MIRALLQRGMLSSFLLAAGCGLLDDKKEDVTEKEEHLKRRKAWFDQSTGKPFPTTEAIDSEMLKESRLPTVLKEKPENPYPIYRPATAPSPVSGPADALPFEDDSTERIQTTLDFNGAAPADVIAVFAGLLKLNFQVDGTLTGAITLSLNEALSKVELWRVLCQVLRSAGIHPVLENKIVHFRPSEAIPQSLLQQQESAEIEVGVFALKNIALKEAAAQIGQFLSKGGKPIELESRNLLLIVDTRKNLEKIRGLIALLDQPLRYGWAKMVIPCRSISASRLAREITQVLPVLGFPVSLNNEQPKPEELQLTSIDRLQIIVASAANYEALDELGRWVGILDQSDVGEQERLFIYNILNGNAEELVKAMSVMFPVEGSTLAAGKDGAAGNDSAISSTSGKSAPQAFGSTGRKQATASDGPANVFEVPVRVFADAIHNRLLIRTTPRTYAMVKALLERIDTIPAQVLLQVLVVDVSLNDSIKFGIEFMMTGGSDTLGVSGGTNYTGLIPGVGTSGQSGGQFMLFNPGNPNEKFGYLNALAGKTNVKVVSSPQLLITSHNAAKISVGSKVPIVNSEITNTQSIIAGGSDSSTNLVRNIQYQDTGIILKITPRITRGGRIALEVNQTVSEADSNNISGIDSPIIKEQVIETVMSIRDGQTIICGGMIREKTTDNLSTLPILGSIPFVRRLLGDTDVSTERTEMMILISGHIINENTQLEDLLSRYRDAVDGLIEFHEPPELRKQKMQKKKGLLETWFIE